MHSCAEASAPVHTCQAAGSTLNLRETVGISPCSAVTSRCPVTAHAAERGVQLMGRC